MNKNKSKIIFLCYHYLTRQDEFNRIWGHDFDLFKKHVDFLKNNYPPISMEDLDGYLEGRIGCLPERCSVISFDDSLKEQSKIIAPYLSDNNIKGLFNISTCILDNEPINPQIIHFSTAYFGIRKFVSIIKNDLAVVGLDWNNYSVFVDKYNDVYKLLSDIKKFIKYELHNDQERQILMDVWNNYLIKDFPNLHETIYMSKKDIKKLRLDGHSVGLHSHTHPLINDRVMNDDFFQKEIAEPKKRLEELLGEKIKCFAYPFAKKDDVLYDELNIERIKKLGIKYIFTIFGKDGLLNGNFIGRYSSQGLDTVNDLKRNIWEYEIISNNK